MPPKWGPCGAASGWRKSPQGRAQEAREGAARTRMCAQRPPEPAREVGGQDARRPRYLGCVSFGDFSLHKQRKVTVSYTHLRAHETGRNLVCRLLLEKKKK